MSVLLDREDDGWDRTGMLYITQNGNGVIMASWRENVCWFGNLLFVFVLFFSGPLVSVCFQSRSMRWVIAGSWAT